MNDDAAAPSNREGRLFLIPLCGGIIIAIYFFLRLGHGPSSFASISIKVFKIILGIAIALVSWFLGSRQKARVMNFEHRLFMVPFWAGTLVTVYALLRLGHGPSPFGWARVAKIIAGTATAAMSWLFGSPSRVQRVGTWWLSVWLKIWGLLGWLQRVVETAAFKVGQPTRGLVSRISLTVRDRQVAIVESLETASESQENLRRVFVFSLIFSAGLLWLGPFSNYSPPGTLDPWMYTGYFTNFRYLVNRFGLRYYPSRLPYVMFGVLMYKVFSPLAANYLINVAILGADVFSLYAILSRHTGRGIASVSVIALACNPCLIASVSWDYPDGPAIAFLFLGFWMLFAPPNRMKASLATALVGAFWALAGYTNLIAGLIILPGVLVLFYTKRVGMREAMKECVWLATGVGFVTLVFGLISSTIFHTFAFWAAQWNVYRSVTETHGLLDQMSRFGLGWIPYCFRLALTYGLALIGCIIFIRYFHILKKDRFFKATLLLLLLADLLYAYIEFAMKAGVLRDYYHSSFLVVPAFIFLGALFSALRKAVSEGKAWFRVALGMAVVGVVLPMLDINFFLSQLSPLSRNTYWMLLQLERNAELVWKSGNYGSICWSVLFVVGVLGLVGAGSGRRFGVIVAAFCFSFLVTFSAYVNLPYVFRDERTEFTAVLATQDLLKSGILQDRPILMWYDNDEAWSTLYNSIQSLYLWGYHDLTHELPTMKTEDLRYLVPPDTVIVHLTTVPAKVPERDRLLAVRKIQVEDIGRWTVQRGAIKFEIYAQHVLNGADAK
jgi:hypothetical protein